MQKKFEKAYYYKLIDFKYFNMITGYWGTFPGIKLRAVQCVLRWWIGDLRPLFADFEKELVHHSRYK
jgi:hypothetical protein